MNMSAYTRLDQGISTAMLAGLVVCLGTGLILVGAASERPSVGLLWAAASLVGGGILGLLFGIPRVNLGEEWENSPRTNLEQISGWLTMMLVGVGLVELRAIPQYTIRAAKVIANSLGDESAQTGLATALLIYFTAGGFIGVYLLARFYLSADQRVRRVIANIRDQVLDATKASDKDSPLNSDVARARQIGLAALDVTRSSIENEVRILIGEYDQIQSSMEQSGASTEELAKVMRKLSFYGFAAGFMLPELSMGYPSDRIAAIAFLKVTGDPAYIDWLARRFESQTEPALAMYHSALALLAIARRGRLEDSEHLIAAYKRAIARTRERSNRGIDERLDMLANELKLSKHART